MQPFVLVDPAVIASADELFVGRHYASVVAVCTEALDAEPRCIDLLLMRARARIKLRRDRDAQADLREIIRLDPQCGTAYRYLGELAARRDENNTAAIFFREAMRLSPGDAEAHEWLQIVERPSVRLARGTRPPDEEPTTPRGVLPPSMRTPAPVRVPSAVTPTPVRASGSTPDVRAQTTDLGVSLYRPVPAPPRREPPRTTVRPSLPEHPGFGDYLVAEGIVTRERLRAAQAYQRSMNVQLATAIVTLGLATQQKIEWAAVAHQAKLSGKL